MAEETREKDHKFYELKNHEKLLSLTFIFFRFFSRKNHFHFHALEIIVFLPYKNKIV